MKAMRNEVHLTQRPNGHESSTDCWCEPTRMYWYTNRHGITMYVVEHNDTEETIQCQHEQLVNLRTLRVANAPSQDWVTHVLNSVGGPDVRS